MKISQKKLRKINLSLLLIISYLIVILICFLSYFNFFRIDINKHSEYSISPNTKNLLFSLNSKLNIYIVIETKDEIYSDLQNLIDEYSFHSDMLDVFWIDPVKNPSRTEELIYSYKLNSYPAIVIDNGFQSRVIYNEELRKINSSGNIISFDGERVISNSIFEISNGIKPKIYFSYGNGENRIDDFSNNGFSSINIDLEAQSMNLESFNLDGFNPIPSDADAIVIAGPKKKINDSSLNMIEKYLNSSGRLLILLDSYYESGLEKILNKWSISLTSGFVYDQLQTLKGRDVNVNKYGKHEITNEIDFLVRLLLPRAIVPISLPNNKDVDVPKVSTLLKSSDNSWIETSSFNRTPVFEEANGDMFGPIQLGVAIERGAIQELDVEIPSSRIVVIGDSDFICNANLIDGNKDFFRRTINWLVDRNNNLTISPRNITNVKITTSSKDLKFNFILSVIIIPISVLLIGLIIYIWRRK